MLDLADEALDHLTFFVNVTINLTLLFSVATRRDDRFRALFFDAFDKVRRVVTRISAQHLV